MTWPFNYQYPALQLLCNDLGCNIISILLVRSSLNHSTSEQDSLTYPKNDVNIMHIATVTG